MSADEQASDSSDVPHSEPVPATGSAFARSRTTASFLLQQQAYIAYQQRKQHEKEKEKIAKAQHKTAKKLAKHGNMTYPYLSSSPYSSPYLSPYSSPYSLDPQPSTTTAETSRVVECPSPPVAPHGYPTAGYCTSAEKELARLDYETAKIRAKTELKLLKKQQEAAHKTSKQLKKQQYYSARLSSQYPGTYPSMYDDTLHR